MREAWWFGLGGGALIGAAAAVLLATHGRIAGISGIVGSLLPPGAVRDRDWRLAFLGGLIAAGVVGAIAAPGAIGASVRSLPFVAVAGVLVGFGTRLGSGCTSGHGVCGLGRRSMRSLIAVVTFMTTAAVTATFAGVVS